MISLSWNSQGLVRKCAELLLSQAEGELCPIELMCGILRLCIFRFAGVPAARVLSRHFEKVVVVEPDSELE